MQPDALDGWQAESFRLSFIGVPGWVQRPIFQEMTGTQPSLTAAQPMVQMHQEAGEISSVAQLSIVQQSSRIDFVLSDKPRNTFDPTAPDYKPFFSIGPYRESLVLFDSISTKVLAYVSTVVRVAYATTLIRPTENARESISQLRQFLPRLAIDPSTDTDLIFQINRPVHRAADGSLINRLAKWEALQIMTVQVGANSPVIPLVPSRPPISAAQIYIDVSTDAANISPLTNLSELVGELREHIVQLAETGDA